MDNFIIEEDRDDDFVIPKKKNTAHNPKNYKTFAKGNQKTALPARSESPLKKKASSPAAKKSENNNLSDKEKENKNNSPQKPRKRNSLNKSHSPSVASAIPHSDIDLSAFSSVSCPNVPPDENCIISHRSMEIEPVPSHRNHCSCPSTATHKCGEFPAAILRVNPQQQQNERNLKDLLRSLKLQKERESLTIQEEERERLKDAEIFRKNYAEKNLEIQKCQALLNKIRFSNQGCDEKTEQEKLDEKQNEEILIKKIEQHKGEVKQYEERETNRKIHRLCKTFWYLEPDEVLWALTKECGNNEDKCSSWLLDEYNIHFVREILCTERIESNNTVLRSKTFSNENMRNYFAQGASEGRRVVRKRNANFAKTRPAEKKKHSDEKLGTRSLRLDEALKHADTFEGWSEARVRAYQEIGENPNAYYYRFNAPGEAQRNGPWTKKEEELFLERMKECPVNAHWGIFSMKIPGRVGYQCSNFYRLLIKQGRIKDENYFYDEKGKLCFRRGKNRDTPEGPERPIQKKEHEPKEKKERIPKEKKERVPKEKKGTSTDKKPSSPASRRKADNNSKRKKRKVEDDEDDDSDEEFVISSYARNTNTKFSLRTRVRSAASTDDNSNSDEGVPPAVTELSLKKGTQNPLPGYLDPITYMELDEPYVSPSGYVANYSTWLKSLLVANTSESESAPKQKNVCPFTREPITKRQLVRLTLQNIELWMPKLKNLVSEDD